MNPNCLDELNRRDFLCRTARTCFGLTIGGSMARLFDSSPLLPTPLCFRQEEEKRSTSSTSTWQVA